MSNRPAQLPIGGDGPGGLAADFPPPGDTLAETRPAGPKRRKPIAEIAIIIGGVFLAVWIMTYVMTTYIFKETPADETSMELPKTRMETMVAEIPLPNIRQEKNLPRVEGKGPPMVFIVEIDSAVIVHGTTAELLVLDRMIRSHQHRIEEAMDRIIRSATPEDLAEPDSQALRTRIRHRINGFFDRTIVKEVLFSHYRAFHTPIKR